MARFKEFCIDTARDDAVLGEFWAAVSGGRFEPDPPRPGDVIGRHEHEGIAICRVPEARTVKGRMHFDVYAASVDELVARGASVVAPAAETGFGWTTMLDPEGNDFCCFVRDDLPAYRVHGVGIDSADPERICAWWAEALGAEIEDNTAHGAEWWTLLHATPDPVLTLDFAPVPEPKTVKNRVHWDLYGTPAELLDRGATHLWDSPHGWTTLADPEGNEFCVFPEVTG